MTGRADATVGAARPKASAARKAHRRPERNFRWMYGLDAIELFLIMVTITTIRFGADWPNFSRASYLAGFAIVTIIYVIAAYFGGLYDRQHRLGSHSQLARAFRVSAVAALVVAASSLGSDQFLMPRLNLAIFALAAGVALAFNRWLASRVRTARFGPAARTTRRRTR